MCVLLPLCLHGERHHKFLESSWAGNTRTVRVSGLHPKGEPAIQPFCLDFNLHVLVPVILFPIVKEISDWEGDRCLVMSRLS